MPATLPTRAPGDLGAALSNIRTPATNELSAVNVEKIKDWIIAIATELGLTDGSTAGSVWEAIDALTPTSGLPVVPVTGPATQALPAYDALVVLTSAGGAVDLQLPAPASSAGRFYGVIRVNASGTNATTLLRNASEQINGTSGNVALPGSTIADRGVWSVWCDGTNWWAEGGASLDKSPSALLTSTAASNLGRTASAGSATTAARADHVHDRGYVNYASTVTSSVDLPDSDVVPVDTTSGAVTLSPPEGSPVTNAPRKWEILKINAGANKISVDPKSTQTVQGGSAGAAYDLPDSTSTTFPSWTLYRDASGNFRVA